MSGVGVPQPLCDMLAFPVSRVPKAHRRHVVFTSGWGLEHAQDVRPRQQFCGRLRFISLFILAVLQPLARVPLQCPVLSLNCEIEQPGHQTATFKVVAQPRQTGNSPDASANLKELRHHSNSQRKITKYFTKASADFFYNLYHFKRLKDQEGKRCKNFNICQ